MHWERARKPEQKAVRREAILQAARTLFAAADYEAISLNGIAREAGISKPNVYRYFSTREEIFLAMFEAEHHRFLESLIARLKRIRSKDATRQISRVWVEELLEHPILLELLPQLMTSMEKNSSVEQIVEFKKAGLAQIDQLVETLHKLHPKLAIDQWLQVVQCTIALTAGLWPMTNPGESVLKALEHPEVQQPPWEFQSLMQGGIAALIEGTVTNSKGQRR